MRKSLAILLCCHLAAHCVMAQDAPKQTEAEKQKKQEQKQKQMDAWLAMSKPGEFHRHLQDLQGTWDATIEYWADPAAPSVKAKGTSQSKLLMEGRYLQQELQTELMGQPYTVFLMLGYDNLAKQYWGIWLDNLTTALTTMKGAYEEPRKLVLKGEYEDVTSGAVRRTRGVIELPENGRYSFKLYEIYPTGEERMSLIIQFTRR
jgi:Protein of unknown function (DUF1579)